jgi:AmmeMemoRadiSam system protein B
MTIRPPAVAGSFYPAEPATLTETVDRLLAAASPPLPDFPATAVIAPHAGYVYSGPVAASAFRCWQGAAPKRVVVIGPAHYVAFRGIAVPGHTAFGTPLGEIAVDGEAVATLASLPAVVAADRPHAPEHALEVELPFLQRLLPPGFGLVPLVVGDATPAEVAAVLERLWGAGTLVVISSDLSHYHDHATATRLDEATAARIEALDAEALGPGDACGWLAVAGLLRLARNQGLAVRRLDLRNSGDTAGGRAQVVGYGAWALGSA